MDVTQNQPRYRRLAWLLIVSTAIARIAYLGWFCPFDLAPDEAHYWEWSRRLDWAYYSKGPLVAWVIRVSCEMFGSLASVLTGNEALAVRLPAVLFGSLLLAGLFTLTHLVYGDERLALVVVAVALTHPLVAAGSMLMTIDAPFLCAWMWALVFAWRALFAGSRWAWSATGLCVALGLLAKPTMVLWLPAFALLLMTTPSLRSRLREPGVWVMLGIALLGAIPSMVWNLQHDWVTLRHTSTHAGLGDMPTITWFGPLRYLGTQVIVLLGVGFAIWLVAAWRHRPLREDNPRVLFLWWMSVPIVMFFGVFSLKNGGGEPNWPVAGYLAGCVLAAGWLRDLVNNISDRYRHLLTAGVLVTSFIGVLVIGAMHAPIQAQPILLHLAGSATEKHPMPIRRVDPTARLRGWRHLAREVDSIRMSLSNPVIVGERWTIASELAFYCAGHPEVFCMGVAVGDRHSQYDLWRPNLIADAAVYRGRSFILVNVESVKVASAFDRMEPIRRVEYRENGVLIATWTIQVAHGFRGFEVKAGKSY
ncbi:MAG: glycosyltransferase family 39 protein [Gemmataceae bacterium]|nr:glycosyltransferase family 39 protein [Gemmataceae bacterium]